MTADGTLAVIGTFSGTFNVGSGSLSSASPIDFLAGVHASDGSGVWAKQFNDGANGTLKSVAANPGDASATHGNRIAVCGIANQGKPTDLVGSGAIAATGNDVIIGAFKSDGTKLWAAQFSSPGTFNEECDSVALDNNGNVWAIGSTAGASLSFGGATSTLTGPGNSNKKYLWIAEFDGTTGAAILRGHLPRNRPGDAQRRRRHEHHRRPLRQRVRERAGGRRRHLRLDDAHQRRLGRRLGGEVLEHAHAHLGGAPRRHQVRQRERPGGRLRGRRVS